MIRICNISWRGSFLVWLAKHRPREAEPPSQQLSLQHSETVFRPAGQQVNQSVDDGARETIPRGSVPNRCNGCGQSGRHSGNPPDRLAFIKA